ncbi:hypothetical protein L484_027177 [Morus notabilis]|uniref:Uncharacterized protein n=1 Tax=Morus notabilis TaxID=981085 RepID=W9SBR0_9ROSA|nr:hypothetical protein L484_027177 [Morus notabilis]
MQDANKVIGNAGQGSLNTNIQRKQLLTDVGGSAMWKTPDEMLLHVAMAETRREEEHLMADSRYDPTFLVVKTGLFRAGPPVLPALVDGMLKSIFSVIINSQVRVKKRTNAERWVVIIIVSSVASDMIVNTAAIVTVVVVAVVNSYVLKLNPVISPAQNWSHRYPHDEWNPTE